MCKVLIFGCISAVILMTAAFGAPLMAEDHEAPLPAAEKEGLLQTLIKDLDLLKNTEDVNHLDFYTPNDKQECVRSTLQCYQTELKVLEQEIEGGDLTHLQNIRKNLQYLTRHTPSGTGCKKCEAHDKKKFPEFHQELQCVLKSMLKEIS